MALVHIQPDSLKSHPKVLHTISGNTHFYERSDSPRHARRVPSAHTSSGGLGSQSRRVANNHFSLDYFIPSSRPTGNDKKPGEEKPVYYERCPSSVGAVGLKNCPAFEFLHRVEWHEIPKDKTSPKHHGWERIPGMLSNTELESEPGKYCHFKRRDRRGTRKGTNDPIWTEKNEYAFQLGQSRESHREATAKAPTAVRIVPLVGKRKFNQIKTETNSSSTGKGRNEVISDVIEQLTGVSLSRKQISSHIQVLTGFMENGSEWLQAVRRDDLRDKAARTAIRLFGTINTGICVMPDKDKDGNALRRETDGLQPTMRALSGRPPKVGSEVPRPSVRRLEFDTRVWLEKPPKSGDWREIYSFTSMQSEIAAPPAMFEDARGWPTLFPDLAQLHREHGKIDGEVIHIQANFKLEEMPAKSHLGIQVFLDLAHAEAYTGWRYSTRFYSSIGKAEFSSANDLKPSSIRQSSKLRLEIPLESKWWVNILWRFSRQHNAAMALGTLEALQQEARQTRREFQEMSISQEIFAADMFGYERRLATLLWTFDQTVNDEAPSTTWRKLLQHTVSSPKDEAYEDFDASAMFSVETLPVYSDGTGLVLLSTEDGQGQSKKDLEWPSRSGNVDQYRMQMMDDIFNTAEEQKVLHSQESQYTDSTNGVTDVSSSQQLENTIWEPPPHSYSVAYEEPPHDYSNFLGDDKHTLVQTTAQQVATEHDVYQSQSTNQQLEDFTGGEICLQYCLDSSQPIHERNMDDTFRGEPRLDHFGLETSQEVLHSMREPQQQPDDLVLDPAFSDPNHAINNLYHYPTLETNINDLEQPSFPAEVHDNHSPGQQHHHHREHAPVEQSQILASQPESNDRISEHSLDQPQSIGSEVVVPSQHDPSPQSQVMDSLHFEDDWDPTLVPHIFDGADFHATALEILGTEIALPHALDCHAQEYYVQNESQGRDEHARVLGEIGVDIGVDEVKDWVLVQALDDHAS